MSVLFAVEGGATVGLGHLLRCRALMQELAARGVPIVLALRGDSDILSNWTWPKHHLVCLPDSVDLCTTAILAQADVAAPAWVVVDGYGLQAAGVIEALRKHGHRVLTIDDIAERPLDADMVLNQNTERSDLYPCLPKQILLLGPKYALLSDEYMRVRRNPEQREKIARVLVAFGGADLRSFTPRVVAGLCRLKHPPRTIDVIVGPFHKASDPVTAPGIDIRYHLAPADLSDLIAGADLMISAAGSTCWQACCLGVPLIAVQTVTNQREVARTLDCHRAAKVVDGDSLAPDGGVADLSGIVGAVADPNVRATMASEAQALVDGLGRARVAQAMEC